jgi:ABC-type dipeptide/oligopeptide/nickel transport system permease subunit
MRAWSAGRFSPPANEFVEAARALGANDLRIIVATSFPTLFSRWSFRLRLNGGGHPRRSY